MNCPLILDNNYDWEGGSMTISLETDIRSNPQSSHGIFS